MSEHAIEITRLRYPDNVRQNVSMYLGDPINYTHPLQEIINNAEDELLNGYANLVQIINREAYKLVTDNGRGIPIYADPEDPTKSILFSTVTDLHAGSKLGDNREITSGTHGVGSSAVNAVSERFVVIRRVMQGDKAHIPMKPGQFYVLGFRRGVMEIDGVINDLNDLRDDGFPDEVLETLTSTEFSTAVFMVPDATLYRSIWSDVDTVPLKISLIGRDATITLNGEALPTWDFRRDVAENEKLFLDTTVKYEFSFNDRLTFSGELGYSDKNMSYSHVDMINLINNPHGGLHEKLVTRALGGMLNKVNSAITVGDAKLGLIVFTNVFSSYRTAFSSQTKEKLTGLGMSWSDWEIMAKNKLMLNDEQINDYDYYGEYFFYEKECLSQLTFYFSLVYEKNKQFFDALIAKILAYKASLNKLSNMDFIKSKLVMGDDHRKAAMDGDMAKIYESPSDRWDLRELFITEGPSASGNIIKLRNEYQSVLPLRGKMRNSASMDIMEFVNNPELLAIINTIGCGMGQMFDLDKARYSKIIIMTDLDVDGQHISNLISSIFLIHAPELVKDGRLYKLEAPFYVVKNGKKTEFYYADEKDKIDFDKCYVERRKGLGSYTEEETEQFIINSKTRRLIQVTYDDNEEHLDAARKLLYSSRARRQLLEDYGLFKE